MVQVLKKKVLHGYALKKEEALSLLHCNLDDLCKAANEIREFFCKDSFDLCSIINGRSGKCSENCKFCAQSSHYKTRVEEYPLLESDEITAEAVHNEKIGILRFSIVTSGKRLTDEEVDRVCNTYKNISKKSKISLCASMGLLTYNQFVKLKDAGVTRYHNNLETSRRFFPRICTTHTYDDKVETIQMAQKAGLTVCSGGIMGLGETMEDRIDMAIALRTLKIKSIPINILNPISGTPFENTKQLQNDEIRRIVAIYRFLLPNAVLRLAGGRLLLKDLGSSILMSGANGAITQNMLTTSGVTAQEDIAMVKKLGFEVRLVN